ncbi:MAG: maleylpyruvate isomerase family mycothiol-dependent enzyme [Microlunatus sp.]|nr:maleylpyruvate isomerase family mycothiol-dependent enzyme [Microlunatus sp.]
MRSRPTAGDALIEQSRALFDWLRDLPLPRLDQESVLTGWDVRTLIGHLVLIEQGLVRVLGQSSSQPPLPAWQYVGRYRPSAAAIATSTAAVTGSDDGPELATRFGVAVTATEKALATVLPDVVEAPRGPLRSADWIETRIIELVVHADDLSRSLPDREPVQLVRSAVGRTVRSLTLMLADVHPGRSVEVRIPPYAAVQCGIGDPGPTHTRGTPPNVVETDALTFLRLATGRTPWSAAIASGAVRASGLRADLSGALPLLS